MDPELKGSSAGTFVGRLRELEALSDACSSVAAGSGRVVFLAGEAGIGKTTLIEEALARCTVRVAWGTCSPAAGAPPYWPWIQVLRQDAFLLPAAEHGGAVGSLLEREQGGEGSRFRLFQGVLDVFRTAAAEGGLVVVLDDLQWADEASLALLSFVAASVRHERLLVVGLYRDTDVADDHPLAQVVAHTASGGAVLELDGLDLSDIAQLLDAVGAVPGEGVHDAGRLQRLHRLTGGNPLFVREMAALAGAGGGLEGELAAGARVPGGVRAVVRRRLARLAHETQDLLVWAALAREPFGVADLAAVTARAPAEVLAALDDAASARVVKPATAGGWMFNHDVVREVLAASLGEATRAHRHWAFGTMLAGTAGHDGARVSQVAGHLVAGVAAGDAGAAVAWAIRAAEASSSVLAYEQAAWWYHQALLIHRSWVGDGDQEIELLLRLGQSRLAAGQLGAARGAFTGAASLARRSGDAVRLAEAALGLGAGLGGFEVQLFDQVQVELLEEALAALGDQHTATRALVLSRLSVALAFVELSPRRMELAEQAIAIARTTGDSRALASALAAWCDACAGPDYVVDRLDAATEIVFTALDGADRPLELLGRRLRVVALLELGRLREARTEIDGYAWVADGLRQPLYQWYVPLWRAALAVAEDDAAAADRYTAEARRLGESADSDNAAVLTTVQHWVRLRHEQRFEEAAAVMADLVAESPDIGSPEALDETVLVVHAARGDAQAATAAADRLARRGWLAPRSDSEWLPNTALLAEVATIIGHRDLARVLHDALRPYAELFAVEGIGAAITGTVAHYLARTAELLGTGEADSFRRLAERLHRDAGITVSPPAIAPAGPTHPVPRPAPASASLRRVDAGWIATYAGETAHVRDSKGLRDIVVLLGAPGRSVHVTELTGAPTGTTGVDLDATAVAAYRRRLAELDAELAEAEDNNDDPRAARSRAERDALIDELSRSLGLGGRARRSGDPVERARKAVAARIRDCIKHLSAAHPPLARHFANAVRTGTWCSYEPEQPVDWHVD